MNGRGRLLLLLVAATAAGVVVGAVSVPQAGASTNESADWEALVNPFSAPEALFWSDLTYSGVVPGQLGIDGVGEQMIFDVICGATALECLGPIVVASVATLALTAVLHSSFGSGFMSWLANLGSTSTGQQSSATVTGEQWCPLIGSTYVPQVVNVPSTCAPISGYTGGNYGGVITGWNLEPDDPGTGLPIPGNGWLLGFNTSGCASVDGLGDQYNGTAVVLLDPSSIPTSANAYNCESALASAASTFQVPAGTQTYHYTPSQVLNAGGTTCAQMAAHLGVSNYQGDCTAYYLPEAAMATDLGPSSYQACGNSGQMACPNPSGVRSVGSSTTTTNCAGTSVVCDAAMKKAAADDPGGVKQHNVDCYTSGKPPASCASSGGGGGGGPSPFALPQPLPTETYAQYVTRLRNLGFWGWIYEAADDMSYPEGSEANALAPGAITEVGLSTGTGVSLAVPLYYAIPGHGLAASAESSDASKQGQSAPWPSPDPTVQTSVQTIVVQDVPNGYVPDSPPPPGSGGDGIDMSPLTSLAFGCNFPFGVLCWVNGAVSAFSAAPVAPDLNWVMPSVVTYGGAPAPNVGGKHYDVNLGQTSMDTYMGWIRDLETFVLWAGAIWYVGSRLIGLKGGGDPSLASEEAFGDFTS